MMVMNEVKKTNSRTDVNCETEIVRIDHDIDNIVEGVSMEEVVAIPALVAKQMKELTSIEKQVEEAMKKASTAKGKAEKAKEVKVGWLRGKSDAIKALQDAAEGLANAQISSAQAQTILFEYQKNLSEIMKGLFGLGIMNLAANRTVVRELELKLKGASSKDLSALAKSELKGVIAQLNAQRDIMERQESLAGNVKSHEIKIRAYNTKLEELEADDDKQDELIAENAEKISDHAKKLEEMEADDDKQDELIALNKEEIIAIKKTIISQGEEINALKNRITELEENAHKIGWKITISIVAVSALVLEILNLIGIL